MLDHLSVAKRCQVGDTQVDAHILVGYRQRCRLLDFARAHDEPLIDFPLHGDHLDFAFDLAVELNLDIPNLGETERPFERVPLFFYCELPTGPIRVAKAIITGASFEAGKACSIKEPLECPLYPQDHILQHMSGDVLVLFTHRFDLDQGALLPTVADCLYAFFPTHLPRYDT